jgi:hypothetical protein
MPFRGKHSTRRTTIGRRKSSRKNKAAVDRDDDGVVEADADRDDDAVDIVVKDGVVEVSSEHAVDSMAALKTITSFRLSVASLFAREFNAEPDEEKWRGHGGIISQIQQKLSLNRDTRIDHVMREYLVCLEDGTKYDGESAHLLDQSWQ